MHVQHGLGGQIEVADLLVVVHQVALYQVAVILFGLLLWVDGADMMGVTMVVAATMMTMGARKMGFIIPVATPCW